MAASPTGGSGVGNGAAFAAGTGSASLQGGSGNAAPTITQVEYRDQTLPSWNAQTLRSGFN